MKKDNLKRIIKQFENLLEELKEGVFLTVKQEKQRVAAQELSPALVKVMRIALDRMEI